MSAPWGAINHAEGVVHDLGERVSSGRGNTYDQTSEQPAALLASSDEDDTDGEKDERVTQLARTFTEHSIKTADGHYVNPFENSDDPLLNPHSGSFSQRAWIKTLVGITSRDPERYPARVAGVSYKNLNVHGFGQPTDYQKTFGNYPLAITNLFGKFRGDRGKTKIQILRNFDGLVKSGEMLVVLGRPGRKVAPTSQLLHNANWNSSGCSTLLKTISGETHGFFVDDSSEINYQGSLCCSVKGAAANSSSQVFQWR
jgi:hypothetical protein